MILYGITWASLTICPYDIFAKIIPKKNNGYYMGIFNMAIVIPQIIAGLFLGTIYKFVFNHKASSIIIMSGCSLLISTYFSFKHQNRTKKITNLKVILKNGL